MEFSPRARVLIALGTMALIGVIAYFVLRAPTPEPVPEQPIAPAAQAKRTIGSSVQGRAIEAYTYGTGPQHLVFVGGIHGGYEWNSVLLAYSFIDYLEQNPVPEDLTVSVIPAANPDGLFAVVRKEGRFAAIDASTNSAVLAGGRFNANKVDLNRNFDCKWQPESTWRSTPVSAGTSAFSEPEARAIRDFVLAADPVAVVFWHSQANAVYASECEAGILPGTLSAMNAYATAAQYPAVSSFDAYPVTGDAEGWLASVGIPAITVELSTHESVEWERNLPGIRALMSLYSASI